MRSAVTLSNELIRQYNQRREKTLTEEGQPMSNLDEIPIFPIGGLDLPE